MAGMMWLQLVRRHHHLLWWLLLRWRRQHATLTYVVLAVLPVVHSRRPGRHRRRCRSAALQLPTLIRLHMLLMRPAPPSPTTTRPIPELL